jgi:hypothetical protein
MQSENQTEELQTTQSFQERYKIGIQYFPKLYSEQKNEYYKADFVLKVLVQMGLSGTMMVLTALNFDWNQLTLYGILHGLCSIALVFLPYYFEPYIAVSDAWHLPQREVYKENVKR